MPPKKRATRAATKAESEEPQQIEDLANATVEEPVNKKQKTKGRSKKSAAASAADTSATAATTTITTAVVPAASSTSSTVTEKKDNADITKSNNNETPKPKAKAPTKTNSKKDTSMTKKETPTSKKATPKENGKVPNVKKQQLTSTLALAPSSPTKSPTKPSISRIPSPMRKPSLAHKLSIDSLEQKRSETLINQMFVSKDIPKLTSIIEELKTTRADQLFTDLKASTDARAKVSEDLITTISTRNEELSKQLESALARISELEQNGSASSADAIPKGETEESEYENQLILDMMEQIVGLRIHNTEETDDALSFSCSQSGTNGILDYKLIISKEDSSEIIYEPANNAEETEQLKKILPTYFFDYLTFPLDTLQQFYHKIYRGLNK